jgi:hypothetical protein
VEGAGRKVGERGVAQGFCSRARISFAALFVNVTARTRGGTPRSRNEEGDPVRQHVGLARTGPGEDEERATGVGQRGAFLRIQDIEDRIGTHHSMVGIAIGA